MDSDHQHVAGSGFSSIGTSLLVRVKAQDAEAWRRLVRLYGPLVYHWCSRSGIQDEDSSDIGQEVFRAVAKGIENFRRENKEDTFGGWLRTITRNKINDYLRRRAKHPPSPGGSEFQSQLGRLPEQLDDEDLGSLSDHRVSLFRRACELLRTDFQESTWQAFWKTAVDERETAEVAAELEMTPTAVRKAKSRVLRRLRDEFDGEIEG